MQDLIKQMRGSAEKMLQLWCRLHDTGDPITVLSTAEYEAVAGDPANVLRILDALEKRTTALEAIVENAHGSECRRVASEALEDN